MGYLNLNNAMLVVAVLVVVCLFYWYMGRVEWTAKSSPAYGSYSPASRYPDVVAEFGEPDTIDRNPGGGALWFKKSMTSRGKPWEMVMMLDEAVPHDKPAPHADFLYSWLRINIPNDETLQEILKLSKSISYDPLKKLLQVRCHFMGANLATALLSIRMAQKKLTLKQIQDQDLYAKYIFRTAKAHKTYDANAEEEYEAEISEYVKF